MFTYLRPMIFCAVVAGLIAGGAVSITQWLTTISLIDRAEQIEAVVDHAHETGAAQSVGKHTWFANVVIAIGFALMFTALAGLKKSVHWGDGLKWACLGFFMFFFLPAWILSPALPGAEHSSLLNRQILWFCTALFAAATGWMVLFGTLPTRLAGVVAVALFMGLMPRISPQYADPRFMDLAQPFYWSVFGSQVVFWAILGLSIGLIYPRLAGRTS